jgi:drug/metabolite transporter (DMT)-like permease
MNTLTVSQAGSKKRRGLDFRFIAAFFAIYVIWGSTFLAIRTAVLLVPPWLCAGIRFFTAGLILYAFSRLRHETAPMGQEWRNLAMIGLLMFSVTYGALFWAEQYVPSGVTSVLEATLPLFTVVLEVFVFRQQRFQWRVVLALVTGFCGVAVMLLKTGEGGLKLWPCLAVLGGSLAWSTGSVLTRSLPLPKSRLVTAGAEMMLGGSGLLVLSAVTGELHPFPAIPMKAAVALVYLISAGSLVGYTAFVWLLGQMPASRVASHAYVNPIIAITLGYFFASEEITLRTLVGAVLVIGSVVLTMMERSGKAS